MNLSRADFKLSTSSSFFLIELLSFSLSALKLKKKINNPSFFQASRKHSLGLFVESFVVDVVAAILLGLRDAAAILLRVRGEIRRGRPNPGPAPLRSRLSNEEEGVFIRNCFLEIFLKCSLTKAMINPRGLLRNPHSGRSLCCTSGRSSRRTGWTRSRPDFGFDFSARGLLEIGCVPRGRRCGLY